MKQTNTICKEPYTNHTFGRDSKCKRCLTPRTSESQAFERGKRDAKRGVSAFSVPYINKERAELLGYQVVSADDVLATHLTEVITAHAHEILGRQNVQALLDGVKKDYPAVVGELVPDHLPLGGVQKVLQNLLKERVPIRDMVTILETAADYAPITKDPEILAEYARTALGRTICQRYQTVEGSIPVLTVSPRVESLISESVQNTVAGIKVALPPDTARQLFEQMAGLIDGMVSGGQQPLVLTAPAIRLAFRRLTETTFPSLAVLSYNEVVPGIEVFSVGMIDLEAT